ncbi:MAG: response regulator [Flavobacteriales bacterium]|nr:response regulator [Flavobacteriales bacterium]
MNKKIAELLLVEDNPFDAELTLTALKEKNLANSLYHVEDGAEALDFVYARGKYTDRSGLPLPNLILLDLKMPKLNGMEVLRSLKSDPQTKCIPIVVLTSSKEDPDIKECYRLGVNSYIVKPVGFENFVKAVTEVGFYWALLNTNPDCK